MRCCLSIKYGCYVPLPEGDQGGGKKVTLAVSFQMRIKRLKEGDTVSPTPHGLKGEALPEHNLYNPVLRPLAHNNRYEMTKAEACLWKYALRAGQMKGYNFNRQRPVLNYIADFMCKKINLIVEVDGISHSFEGANEKDLVRQTNLEKAGFTVLRFKDADILKDIKRVKQIIYDVLVELENSPPPTPSERGTRL